MPESIPDAVNDNALNLAADGKFSNIRILGVINAKTPSFHILFFSDALIALKAFVIEMDTTRQSMPSKIIQVNLPYQNLTELKLSKIATDTKCWTLATIYSGTGYSGTSFTFSQTTTTYGWYHKVINNLGMSASCCAGNYSGNLNNAISSHYWQDDYYSPLGNIARPICIHAFDLTNRNNNGNHTKFERPDAYYTGFGTGYPGTSCYQINEESNWGLYSIGAGTASSLDMFYRVFMPGSC